MVDMDSFNNFDDSIKLELNLNEVKTYVAQVCKFSEHLQLGLNLHAARVTRSTIISKRSSNKRQRRLLELLRRFSRFKKLLIMMSSMRFLIIQTYFVDKGRNACVVIGDRDLKSDVKDKKRRDRQVLTMCMILNNFEHQDLLWLFSSTKLILNKILARKTGGGLAEEDDDYMTYVNQARYELRSGSAEVAIKYLNLAVHLNPEDEIPFIVRSKCHIR